MSLAEIEAEIAALSRAEKAQVLQWVVNNLGEAFPGIAIPDEQVLRQATGEQRAVLTFNRRHFIRLHAAQPQHQGNIVCTFDTNFPELATRIHDAIIATPNLIGQLLRINRPG